MTLFSVDVEANGQLPGVHSLVSVGAVAVREGLADTFYAELVLTGSEREEAAWSVARKGLVEGQEKLLANSFTNQFRNWIIETTKGRPIMISDNPAFDFPWINFYMMSYNGVEGSPLVRNDPNDPNQKFGPNPFGWSARRIGDLYCGMQNDTFAQWKHLRDTPHDHNALGDAIGNAEVILKMKEMGLKLSTK